MIELQTVRFILILDFWINCGHQHRTRARATVSKSARSNILDAVARMYSLREQLQIRPDAKCVLRSEGDLLGTIFFV